MARTISVRLDDEAHRALMTIQNTGLTSSAAIRTALVREAGRLRSPEVQREEFLTSQADSEEQRILRESLDFLESIDGPW
ncbi:MAG: hypothetical protein ACKODP_01700 [Actinomycetota bacterium]